VRDTLHARALESVALLYLNGAADCPRTQEMQTRLEFGSILQAVPTTYARAFASAAEILGGAEALSDYLKVPRYQLMQWIKGTARPSASAFRGALALLEQADPEEFAAQERNQKPTPK